MYMYVVFPAYESPSIAGKLLILSLQLLVIGTVGLIVAWEVTKLYFKAQLI